MIKRHVILTFSLLLLLFSGIYSCKSDGESDVVIVNRNIKSLMEDNYLWYDHLPDLNPEDFNDPDAFIKALRYPEYDRWSFVITKDEYLQYFVYGEMIGYGFIPSNDAENNIRIALVYPSTDTYAQGVRRGWIIRKINNVTATPDNFNQLIGPTEQGITNEIEFTDNNGNTVTLSLSKEVITLDPVVHSEVIDYNGKKIGYLVFQDFIATANAELDDAFDLFRQEQVNDLIIDLRYNGGGSLDVALYLAGWLRGNADADQDLINFRFNDKHTDMNESAAIPYNENSLDLSRVVFIGTVYTASASELIINSMEPYMDAVLVGTPTDGKPVGMQVYVFRDYNYAVFPVTFAYTNANDEGDFYNGLQPDVLVNDDVTKDFGDESEGMLNAALNYISPGIVAKSTSKSTASPKLVASSESISRLYRAY